jgi:putative membrane protein
VGWIIGVLLLFLVVALVASAMFFWVPLAMGTTPYFAHPFFMLFFFLPLGFVLFLLLIALVFSLAFRPWRRRYYRRWRDWDDANEILRQRYARGEITKEQFEQMQRDLEQHR